MMEKQVDVRPARTPEEISKALEIRRQVFVVEQGIGSDLDVDGLDSRCLHVLAWLGELAIATGRLRVEGETGVLARIAVLPKHRGRGVGRLVVSKLEELAKGQALNRLELHPHLHLEGFYSDLGYRRRPGEFAVGGYRLLTMVKDLKGG